MSCSTGAISQPVLPRATCHTTQRLRPSRSHRIDYIRSGVVMSLTLLSIALLAQTCDAWNVVAPSSRLATRLNVQPVTSASPMYNDSRDRAILRKSGQRRELALQLRLLSVQGAVIGATAARAGARTRTSATDGDDVNGGDSAADIISSNSSLVKARLSKPVGLVLAEKEMGKPGLVVDDMVEGGSAEVSGIVARGMTLVSACGVECGELVFDEVVEMLQNSPPEAPIDFIFSTTTAEPGST